MAHSAVAMQDISIGTVTMNHSAVAVITDCSVADDSAVVFVVSYFVVATSEYILRPFLLPFCLILMLLWQRWAILPLLKINFL